MNSEIVVLMPGRVSEKFNSFIRSIVHDYPNRIIKRADMLPSLQDKKILWAIELNECGFNISLEKMLASICRRGNESLRNSQAVIIIQSPLEIWTKNYAYRIIFYTNQLGCRYIGHAVVEATKNIINFTTWQKQLNMPLEEIYQRNSIDLINRLFNEKMKKIVNPKVLVLYSNPRKTSNTMMLWQMVKKYITANQFDMEEKHVENGTIVDCRGCLYKTCRHYSERKSCFYGGIVVKEILPAIEKADCLVWLCPNYNDAVSAKLMAVINRLTVLYKRVDFSRKKIFSIIVSGNSGSENVAMQLIGALNVNKGFHLPPYFSLMAIANDPGTVKNISDIQEKAKEFANNIYHEINA